ncbi:Uncharacterised protein [Amycolatopsis camponoti]|uniref:Uncharacterized protein n=1 Tax=Amycolatopsis camponoti TaxID=2606593 RepID=A0A6I8LJ00_9PSEU|nr:Uncharacterised protein [Amycolatopsis camponoti]
MARNTDDHPDASNSEAGGPDGRAARSLGASAYDVRRIRR